MYQLSDSLVCIYKIKDVTHTMKIDMKDLYHDNHANNNNQIINNNNKNKNFNSNKYKE